MKQVASTACKQVYTRLVNTNRDRYTIVNLHSRFHKIVHLAHEASSALVLPCNYSMLTGLHVQLVYTNEAAIVIVNLHSSLYKQAIHSPTQHLTTRVLYSQVQLQHINTIHTISNQQLQLQLQRQTHTQTQPQTYSYSTTKLTPYSTKKGVLANTIYTQQSGYHNRRYKHSIDGAVCLISKHKRTIIAVVNSQ